MSAHDAKSGFPPSPPSHPGIGALFALRAATGRWPQAARAAVCMGGPVLAGWVAGNIGAGLLATIGAFTALYGGDRPYLSRAGYLAVPEGFANPDQLDFDAIRD